jgi:predicted homoserine dehydrogenase-like protein
MGSGFVTQVARMKGMEVKVLADENVEAARKVFLDIGVNQGNIVEAHAVNRAADALREKKYVISGSYGLAAQLEEIDIVADVTPSPAIGAETAVSCIQHAKDVVMVNIEADVTVGHILHQKANQAGIIYTVSSGDEPGCLIELWDFVNSQQFEPIVIGKGKNNPLNPSATPDTVIESAKKSNKDPFQIASYVDGTKTMFEMCCAANATGCVPMQPGMAGPVATIENVSQIFALEADGGITKFPGVVDFVQGKSMSGGVFITVRVDNPRIKDDLIYMGARGSDRYFTFFRPYHLWFIEAPISVAKAFLYKKKWLVPLKKPVADVLAIAKRDLKPGDLLDQFGGYTFYGKIDTAEAVKSLNGLPVGLAPGAKITATKKAGEVITWTDVDLPDTQVVKLRKEQNGSVN